MIEICPAILTSDLNEFKRELEAYSNLFKKIDVDINIPGDKFSGLNTLSADEIYREISVYKNTQFNLHLMVQNPSRIVAKFKNLDNTTFFVHQEANINALIGISKINLAVQIDSKNKTIDFYNQFNEIQIMTVDIGFQGSNFTQSALSRVEWLRNSGYKGWISVDGGVNLLSAPIIKKYDIQRVSVGSYFSNSKDLILDKTKLQLALNVGAGS